MNKLFNIMITTVLILAFTVSSLANPSTTYGATDVPGIVAETGILIDAKSGMVLYDKGIHSQLNPASTTKVLTALLALEMLSLDTVVTMDTEVAFTEGSRIYLVENEEMTVENLLYALLLQSANDAAVALAKEMSGSVQEFAVLMNKKAKELGALNTNFVNPHGLTAEGHVSTAYDLAMITKAAMENEKFREYVTTYRHYIPPSEWQKERYLYNTNRLIYDEATNVSSNGVMRPAKYEGSTGIKTGFTAEAGGCLVAGAERDGSEFIAVVLKSTSEGRFGDSIALLDYAFANYKSVKIVEGNKAMGTTKVKRGEKNKVKLISKSDGYSTIPIEAAASVVTTKITVEEKLEAPIKKGQVVGQIEMFQGGVAVGSVDIITTENIKEGGLLSMFGIPDSTGAKVITGISAALVIFIALTSLYVILKRRQIRKRKERRAQRAMKIVMEREQKKLEEDEFRRKAAYGAGGQNRYDNR